MGSLKGSVIGWLVTAFVMAIAWSLMDMPQLSRFTNDFFGKVLVSFMILMVSKVVSRLLGGD